MINTATCDPDIVIRVTSDGIWEDCWIMTFTGHFNGRNRIIDDVKGTVGIQADPDATTQPDVILI